MAEDEIRLVKFLSESGCASRRGAGELVKSGRVSVNGATVFEPGLRIKPGDRVELDGMAVCGGRQKVYLVLNKPVGYVCSAADRHADKLALDLLREVGERVFSAGRLDKDSEGMLIFSNDGEYIDFLSHPRYEVSKVYEVTTARPLEKNFRDGFVSGVELEGEVLRVLGVDELGKCKYRFRLNEGKKREIRRLCAFAGAPVKRLKRVRIGKLPLGNLPVGKYRFLNAEEVELSKQKG